MGVVVVITDANSVMSGSLTDHARAKNDDSEFKNRVGETETISIFLF